jgi:quinol monooxygenase YgiN
MAGVVHVPWYATVFRGDKLEAALQEIAPLALRYGATSYAVHRNRDDPYKMLQMSAFESKQDWERYWNGPDMIRFRAVNQSLYQVPLLYSWATITIEGSIETEGGVQHEGLQTTTGASGTGDMM